MKRALLILAVIAGCHSKKQEVPPPEPVVEVEETGPWRVLRTGGMVVVGGPEDLHLYAGAAPRNGGDRYPGIAIGTARGPELTLLSGAYAPLLIPDHSDRPHRMHLASRGATLAVAVGEAFTARFAPPSAGRLRIVTEGEANLVVPANETKLSGQQEGKPLFLEEITAGGDPGLEKRRAGRLEATVPNEGVITVETSCVARWIRPLPRGSTSSFVIRLGPHRTYIDPRYAPAGAVDEGPPCAGTATITVPWPPSS